MGDDPPEPPLPELTLRPELARIVDELRARHSREVSLDEVADAIGAIAISLDEIELVMTNLEQRGLSVGAAGAPPASTHLKAVLQTARQLRSELGRTPAPTEIAIRAGLSVDEVRLALLAAQIMQR